MAVTRKGSSITMTADADAYAGIVFVAGLTLQVASGTPGDRLRLTDAAGDVIADYLVTATTDNADLWGGKEPKCYQNLLVEDFPTGTAVLTVFLE
jgi:hypothetical protein